MSLLNPVLHYVLFRFTSHLPALLKLLLEKKVFKFVSPAWSSFTALSQRPEPALLEGLMLLWGFVLGCRNMERLN